MSHALNAFKETAKISLTRLLGNARLFGLRRRRYLLKMGIPDSKPLSAGSRDPLAFRIGNEAINFFQGGLICFPLIYLIIVLSGLSSSWGLDGYNPIHWLGLIINEPLKLLLSGVFFALLPHLTFWAIQPARGDPEIHNALRERAKAQLPSIELAIEQIQIKLICRPASTAPPGNAKRL